MKDQYTDEAQAIDIARKQYAIPSDNDIEIDEAPATSTADEGIWVAAWVWVRMEDIEAAHEADASNPRALR